MSENWNSNLYDTWAGASLEVTVARPVFLQAQPGFPNIAGPTFHQLEAIVGSPIVQDVFIERQGLILEANGISPSEWKLITAIYPIITGFKGAEVYFYIGGELGQPESGVDYQGPYPYIIGETTKIDCLVTCRYPAYKLLATTQDNIILEAMGFEYEAIGQD